MLHRNLVLALMLGLLLAACAGPSQPTEIPYPQPKGGVYPPPVEEIYPSPGQLPPYPASGDLEPPPPGDEENYPAPEESPDTPVSSPGDFVEPLPAEWAPAPGDEKLQRGQAFIDQADLLTLESFPPQFTLSLRGSLPTPCHQLRVKITPADAEGNIQVEVYSLVDPGMICVQILQEFEANVPLGSLPAGKYSVLVNSKPVGEIEAP